MPLNYNCQVFFQSNISHDKLFEINECSIIQPCCSWFINTTKQKFLNNNWFLPIPPQKIEYTGNTNSLSVCRQQHHNYEILPFKNFCALCVLFSHLMNLSAFFVTFLALVTCHNSQFTCDVSHFTFHLLLTPTATNLLLLSPPLSTVDSAQIKKALSNHGQKSH